MAVEQPTTKTCTKCAETKPVSEFGKAKHHKDGLKSHCKACCNAWHFEYHKRNSERLKPIRRDWYLRNKVEHNKRSLAGYYANREEWWRRAKEWVRRNRHKMRAYVKRYYYKNPQKEADRRRKYRKLNPWLQKATNANRRARLRGAGRYTAQDVQSLLVLQKRQCVVCRIRLTKFHVDHIIPLALGGRNERDNLQLLCPTCNHKKHAKDPIAFMQEMGYLL
jgi:5-methylcytosine-specific restriction endonuclease McrA